MALYTDSYSVNLLRLVLQVVERVTIFVMDANDEKPEFQNMPGIIDVLEVGQDREIEYLPVNFKGSHIFSQQFSM